MDVKTGYTHWAEIYDANANFTRDLDQRVTKKILNNLTFDHIIEAGCGTGKNTVFFSQIGKKVEALDFSPEMLQIAQSKISAKNVVFKTADLTKNWPTINQSADLICFNLVLEHIRDLHHVFKEAERTLKTEGILLISELHPFRQYVGKKARFKKDGQTIEVEAYIHNISDFLQAAENKFQLCQLKEWWNPEKQEEPPRVISFTFKKY